MKLNFFKSRKQNKISQKDELGEYDKHVEFYYTNIINSLILFTYNSEQLEKMAPVLIDPLTELYEELQYACTPVCLEAVLRNNLIDQNTKEALLMFKSKVENIPNEGIWDWPFIDVHENWKEVKMNAEELLNKIGVFSRTYNQDFITIMLNTGEIIIQGKKP